MPSPCNNLNVVPIKVSQLVRYKNIDANDYFLTIESGSALYSRKSTFGDLVSAFGRVTGSYTGSFSGSYWGSVISKNTKATGSFSGSYWGSVISKNTKVTGSFSGSYWGSVVSKNTKATGSFSSTNSKLSGSFSGSYWGSVVSKNTKATGSFCGINSKLSGSFSGSYWGSVISKNIKATGSFSGTNSKLSGSFSGSSSGRFIGKNSLITGSFRGIDNITNFKGTGKKVSFNGTSSYSVSSSYANNTISSLSSFPSSTYSSNTSTNTVASFVGGANEGGVGTYCYAVAHGFGSAPGLIRATLYCNSADVGVGYVAGDEVNVEVADDDTGGADDERNIFSVWTNNTYAAISCRNPSGGVYITTKTAGGRTTINTNKWNLKIRVWK